jgi:hypothetical protein
VAEVAVVSREPPRVMQTPSEADACAKTSLRNTGMWTEVPVVVRAESGRARACLRDDDDGEAAPPAKLFAPDRRIAAGKRPANVYLRGKL